MARILKPYDLHWLEEPIFPPEDFSALSKLARECGIPLAAGENACTAFEFKRMMDAGAVTFHQPSITKVGGITEMRKILTLAETHGANITPHCPYFGPGLLASLHVLATLDDDSLAEFFYYKTLGASLYGDLVRTRDGDFLVPEGPGLGADPDMDVVREYSVKP
jgi:L-alanine-DL-glutamate epimerase-like enolase superfamily enzyme